MKRLMKKSYRLNKVAGWSGVPRLYLDEGPNNDDYDAGPSTQTAIQRGEIDIMDIIDIPGKNGEVRHWTNETDEDGNTVRYFGDYREDKWNDFMGDIMQNGIKEPITIDVEKDGNVVVYEGNHRVEAALQLGLPTVPVEIRYYGNSQREVSRFGLGTGNYEYNTRGWQN
ncbi:ParB-like nuclease domain protein [compost metagenome]